MDFIQVECFDVYGPASISDHDPTISVRYACIGIVYR